MYKEIINNYENAKNNANTIASALASATSADEKTKLTKQLEDAKKEVADLYGKIKAVEVESKFVIGQIIQGEDKSRITINVSPTDSTTFPSFDEKGNEVQATKFGVASRWFLSLTAAISSASRLIIGQAPDILRTLKASLFTIFSGAEITVVRKIALKGEKRRVGEGVYTDNQFYLDKVTALNVHIKTQDEFDQLNFEMWKQTLLNPYNEKAITAPAASLFRLS